MTVRAAVQPRLLTWARERSGIALENLSRRFPALNDWEAGERAPTLKQLQAFATATHTPVGYLFLPEPPEEQLPVPDFRTVAGGAPGQASPDLLDTVYQCQQRQEWYRGYARLHGEPPVDFVATLKRSESTASATKKMRELFGFDPADRRLRGVRRCDA